MEKLYIRTLWEQYREVACPKNAPPIQIDETRKAFYAGVAAIWSIIDQNVNDDLSDEDIGLIIMSIQSELRDYLNLIKLGIA